MKDWAFDNLEWILVAVLAAIVGATIVGISESSKREYAEKQRFMAGCTKERREYECTALWRAGDPKTQTVAVPVVVGR